MRRRINFGNTVLGLFSIAALGFLALPLVVLVVRGIIARGWETLPLDSGVAQAVTLSLLTTLASTLLTLTMGTPLAYVLARWRFPLRRAVTVIVELPIVLPPAVAGLALLITAGRRGVLGGALDSFGIALPFTTAAVVIAQTFISAPFYIRAAQIAFEGVPREIEDSARVDGASGPTLFRTIIFPLTRRALFAGLTLSWTRALGEFGATILFAGSLQVYNAFESNVDAAIWTSILLLGLAALGLLISQWLARSSEYEDNKLDSQRWFWLKWQKKPESTTPRD